MKYNLIYLNGFMYAVEKFKERTDFPYLCLEKLFTGEWELWQVDNENDWDKNTQVNIVATTDPSLNLPLLPAVEEDIRELAKQVCGTHIIEKYREPEFQRNIHDEKVFIKGYKAASAKHKPVAIDLEIVDNQVIVNNWYYN